MSRQTASMLLPDTASLRRVHARKLALKNLESREYHMKHQTYTACSKQVMDRIPQRANRAIMERPARTTYSPITPNVDLTFGGTHLLLSNGKTTARDENKVKVKERTRPLTPCLNAFSWSAVEMP